MKKLATLLALALAVFPAAAAAEEETAAVPSETSVPAEAEPPSFTLSTLEDDGPETARLKAALRLLKHAQVTTRVLQGCAAEPAAEKSAADFMRRNGNTLPLVMNVIRTSGGLTQEIRMVVEEEVAAESEAIQAETGCRPFADLVAKNTRDLYKAPELAEDYRLIRRK